MEGSKKKKGFFGKFISVISGKPKEENQDYIGEEIPAVNSPGKEPVDLLFVKNFTASGGKFLYCEKENEAYKFLNQIASEASIKNVFCKESFLKSILHKAGFRDLAAHVERADAFASGCEYLVSFNGGIMISANQTMGKKLSELPEVFITLGYTSQIVENLRGALTGIRGKYKGNIPSQITTIKGPNDTNQDEAAGSTCKKEIYLLLLEDQF